MASDTLDLYAYVADSLQQEMQEKLDDRQVKGKISQALMNWLRQARKRPVADLEARLRKMELAVVKMVENMKFDFTQGKIVIKVLGSDEDTLKAFRLGTNWFEPNPDLIETIVIGLFDESI